MEEEQSFKEIDGGPGEKSLPSRNEKSIISIPFFRRKERGFWKTNAGSKPKGTIPKESEK